MLFTNPKQFQHHSRPTKLCQKILSHILSFTPNKQIHILKALTALSKFTGLYKDWQQIIESYNLKWSYNNSLESFQNMLYALDTMLKWVSEAIKNIPEIYGNIIIFNT